MEWISVKDRLPDKYETVFVAHNNGKVGRSMWNSFYKIWHFYKIEHTGITHWMPLPEPPKSNG